MAVALRARGRCPPAVVLSTWVLPETPDVRPCNRAVMVVAREEGAVYVRLPRGGVQAESGESGRRPQAPRGARRQAPGSLACRLCYHGSSVVSRRCASTPGAKPASKTPSRTPRIVRPCPPWSASVLPVPSSPHKWQCLRVGWGGGGKNRLQACAGARDAGGVALCRALLMARQAVARASPCLFSKVRLEWWHEGGCLWCCSMPRR